MNELEAYKDTIKHIALVQKLLASAQIELMRRSATHDQSKLNSPEWEMFREVTGQLKDLTYGSDEYNAQIEEMRQGPLAHHYANNRHHPEFFENGVAGMNLFDVLEMVIDWTAATKRHTDGDIQKSIEINTERFGLSAQLVAIISNTIPWIANDFEDIKYQADLRPNHGGN